LKQWLKVRRLRCPQCKKTFTRLPDVLLPFKHYVAAEIESALRYLYEGSKLARVPLGVNEGTLRRWRKEFSDKMREWYGLLEGLLLHNQTPSLDNCDHPLKRLEEALSHLPTLPSRWTVMVKTLWWLKTSYPLWFSGP
jgi:hypothetical protein